MSRFVWSMSLALGALGESQVDSMDQVSLLQMRAKMMEDDVRVWSNVTRDEETGKMAQDELMVANVSALDEERFWSNVTQEGATAVSGCSWVQSGASGSAQEPHCHYSNYKPVCSPANSGRYYYGNPWDVMGGDAKTLATCNGGWYYHGAKPTDRKFTCDCPKPPPPLPAGAVCDWTTTYTSGSFPEPHCHYANFHPSCDANSRGKYYYGNPWDVGGGNAQELSSCNGGWFNHGAKPYHKKFSCDCAVPPTPSPTPAPTPPPAPSANCDWVQSGASGSSPQPHCHYANYKPVCNEDRSGKYYYGNPWDVMGGDAQSLADCNGGWYYHGSKPNDRKFTCTCTDPAPAPAPVSPSASCDWVQSGASGSSPQPHCHYANYKPVCNAANSDKYYYGNPWDVMGGDAQSLANCNGGWFYHGSKPQDRKFTCQCTGMPEPAPAPAPTKPKKCQSGCRKGPYIKKKSCKKKKCAGCCECTGECEAQTKPKKDKTKCEKKCYKKNGNKAMKTSMCNKNKCAACAECSSFLGEVDDDDEDDDDEYYDEDEDDDDDDEDDV